MRKLWNNPGRGQVPMGWTMSPAMLDAMPGALDYYYCDAPPATTPCSPALPATAIRIRTAGRTRRPLDQFVARTEDYTRRAGFRIVTVWNTILGGINTNVGNSFATNAPSLLGPDRAEHRRRPQDLPGQASGALVRVQLLLQRGGDQDRIAAASRAGTGLAAVHPDPGPALAGRDADELPEREELLERQLRRRPPGHLVPAPSRGQRPPDRATALARADPRENRLDPARSRIQPAPSHQRPVAHRTAASKSDPPAVVIA